jgi:hypothetical protein
MGNPAPIAKGAFAHSNGLPPQRHGLRIERRVEHSRNGLGPSVGGMSDVMFG